jgi:hypothetical protein
MQLKFVAQKMPFIKSDLKPKYALGVPAQIFDNYVKNLMAKEAQTNGVDFGLQQSTGENIILSQQQILGTLIGKDDLANLSKVLEGVRDVEDLRRAISNLSSILPDESELRNVFARPDADTSMAQEILNDALRDVPTKYQFNSLLKRLQYAKNTGDERNLDDYANEFLVMLQASRSQEMLGDTLRRVRFSTPPRAGGDSYEDDGYATAVSSPSPKKKTGNSKKTRAVLAEELKKVMNENSLDSYDGVSISDISRTQGQVGYLKKEKLITLLNGLRAQQANRNDNTFSPVKVRGRGLSKRVAPKISIEEGVLSSPSYVPFGRYIIHRHHLGDNMVMMRHKKGGAIVSHPTTKVTRKLSTIIRSIINKEKPSYESVGSLSNDEQQYLHKILHDARLDDQVSIPSPNKSKQEQENDRFEILKGEIRAGNDNDTLVKEFKKLVFKLVQEGRLPRRQGQEILMDLTTLGY